MKEGLLRGVCCIIFICILSGIPVQVYAVRSFAAPVIPTKDGLPIPCQVQTSVLPSPSQEFLLDGNSTHFTSGRDLVDAITSAQANMTSNQIQSGSNVSTEKYITLYTASGQTLVTPVRGSTANFLTLNTSTTLFFNDKRGGDKMDILLQNYTFLSQEYIGEGVVRVIVLLGTKSLLSDIYELHPINETEISLASQKLVLLGGKLLSRYTVLPFIVAELPYERIFEFAQQLFVAHVFLDKKNTVHISESVPLIKPPTEWTQIEQGFGFKINGSGVKIAVLDTGIDKNHPDLNDLDDNSSTYDPKVIDEKCFTGENHVWDGFGHGTHCASIAAGTGEASNHTRVGVAPAALLLNAKVLTDGGSGLDSWIISGIEWAVSKSANVLSMSFGSDVNGDGSDPLSIAVDWATDQGLVCAVAAGNAGSGGMSTLGTPAVSKKAITVGATTKTDEMAYFSSQGPTLDYRLKPDVCAPGVNIVAARANGTSMGIVVDAYYTMANGTSMATPHVSGAAALIIQAHHDWNPIMIKSSLMGNARTLSGEHLWREGAGRIDVCKATNTTLLFVNPSASFGVLKLGNVTKTTLTLMNLAGASATVTVSEVAFCEGQEANYASINASSTVIPGHSNASIALQVGPIDSLAPDGWYEGWVNATLSVGSSTKMPFLFALFSEIAVSVYDVDNLTPIDASIVLATYPDLTYMNYSSASWTNSTGSWKYNAAHLLSKSGNQALCTQMAWIQNGPNTNFARMFMLQKIVNVPKGGAMNVSISLADAKVSYIPTIDSAGNNLVVHEFAQYFSGGPETWDNTYHFLRPNWSMGSLWWSLDLNISTLTFYSTDYAPSDRLCEAFGYYASNALLSEVYLMPFKYWNTSTLPSVLAYPKTDLATYNVFYDMPEAYPENCINTMNGFFCTQDHIGGQMWAWDVHGVCAGVNATFYLAPGIGWFFGDYMPTYGGWHDYLYGPLEEWQIYAPQKGEKGSRILGKYSFAPYQPGVSLSVSKAGSGFLVNLTGDIWKNLSWPHMQGYLLVMGGTEGWISPYPQRYAGYRVYVGGTLLDQGNLNGNEGYDGTPYVNYPPDYLDVDWRGISKTWNIGSSNVLLQLSLPSLATISRNTMYNMSFTLGAGDSTPPILTGISYPLNYAPGQNLRVNFTAIDIGLGIGSHFLKYSFNNGTTWESATYQAPDYIIPCKKVDSLAILVNVTDKAGNSVQYLTAPASLCSQVSLNAPQKVTAELGAPSRINGNLTSIEGRSLDGVAVSLSNGLISYAIPDESGTFTFDLPISTVPEIRTYTIASPSAGLYNSEEAHTEVETVRLAWTNSSVVSGTLENVVRPAIATDSNGFLYAAYEHYNALSFYEIYVSKSTDHGKTWSTIGSAVDLNHNLGHPSITIDVGDNNNIFVALERGYTPTDYDVFVLRCIGGSWSIIPVANVLGNNDRYPSITCEYQYGTSDRVYISYEYVYSYDDRDVMFAKSLDDGATWSLQKLHGGWPDSNVHCQTSIATTRGSDGNDYIYIAYKWGADYNTAYDIVIDKSKDRGSTWTQQWVCDESSRDKNWPSITATHGTGTVVIAWHVYFDATYLNDVQCAYSTNNGDSWYVSWLAYEANVSEENPALTVDGQGSTSNIVRGYVHVVYWKDGKICYKKASYDNPWLWTETETATDTAAIVPAAYGRSALTVYKDADGLSLPCVVWTDFRDGSYEIRCSMKAPVSAGSFMVVRGLDNRIYYQVWNGTGWEGWDVLPGSTIDSPAAAVLGNQLHIVVRGSDGNSLWYGYLTNVTDPKSFSGWTLLSGATSSAPALTSNDTALCLVVRGLDNRIYCSWYKSSWGPWQAVPTGTTGDTPAAAILGNDLHIVVRGMDGLSLWDTIVKYDGSVARGWRQLSGATPSRPVLASYSSSNKLYLVVRGSDNRIYFQAYNGSTDSWQGWHSVLGATIDGPAATVVNDNLYMAVRGTDGNTLWYGYVSGLNTTNNFSGWTLTTGSTPSPPTLAS